MSITDILTACDEYPRVVDFTNKETVLPRPVQCSVTPNFLTETADKEFHTWTSEMAKDMYKTYKHRLPKPSNQKVPEGIHTITEEELTDAEGQESPDTERGSITEDEIVTETEATGGEAIGGEAIGGEATDGEATDGEATDEEN